MNEQMTGKLRFRGDVFGKVVLQVEVSTKTESEAFHLDNKTFTKWRDAKMEDLTEHTVSQVG